MTFSVAKAKAINALLGTQSKTMAGSQGHCGAVTGSPILADMLLSEEGGQKREEGALIPTAQHGPPRNWLSVPPA